MRWNKLGRVYVAAGEADWAASHAYIPTSHLLDEDRVRVYVAFLDAKKVGRIGFVDVEARNPQRVLRVSSSPALHVGAKGTFDADGVSPTCIISERDKLYLYYFGWRRAVDVRYYLLAGLAVSNDGGETFERVSGSPILPSIDEERFVRSAPFVLHDGDAWKMWYVAGAEWIVVNAKQVPTYTIRYLESSDGLHWPGSGTPCLKFESDDEFGFGRPYVIKEQGVYRMWYSIRTTSRGYRIGYATSDDGKAWARKDSEVGIDVSEAGWDSEMVCFPCVQRTKYGTFMFYNGNNYGETGFGVAVLEDS